MSIYFNFLKTNSDLKLIKPLNSLSYTHIQPYSRSFRVSGWGNGRDSRWILTPHSLQPQAAENKMTDFILYKCVHFCCTLTPFLEKHVETKFLYSAHQHHYVNHCSCTVQIGIGGQTEHCVVSTLKPRLSPNSKDRGKRIWVQDEVLHSSWWSPTPPRSVRIWVFYASFVYSIDWQSLYPLSSPIPFWFWNTWDSLASQALPKKGKRVWCSEELLLHKRM